MSQSTDLLTIASAATELACGRQRINALIRGGALKTVPPLPANPHKLNKRVRLPRNTRITRASINTLLEGPK